MEYARLKIISFSIGLVRILTRWLFHKKMECLNEGNLCIIKSYDQIREMINQLINSSRKINPKMSPVVGFSIIIR